MHAGEIYAIIIQQFRLWPHGQAVKTSPSHGENWGSIPHGATKKTRNRYFLLRVFSCQRYQSFVGRTETKKTSESDKQADAEHRVKFIVKSGLHSECLSNKY